MLSVGPINARYPLIGQSYVRHCLLRTETNPNARNAGYSYAAKKSHFLQ